MRFYDGLPKVYVDDFYIGAAPRYITRDVSVPVLITASVATATQDDGSVQWDVTLQVYTYLYAYVYVCMYIHTYIYTYISIHIYI